MVIISKTKHITKRGIVKRNPSSIRTPKGWTKVTKGTYKKGTETIYIFDNKTKISPNQKKWNYSYTVFLDTKDSDKKETFLKKSQALSYAIKYMKSHPRG